MYSIITTLAIVVRSRNSGENGRIFSLFCRELGLVKAHAQGVRKANSKLGAHLADFSFGKYGFILRNCKRIDGPYVNGKLNFWEISDEI